MASLELPALMDVACVVRETGIKKATAEKVMRQCPVVQFPGVRKVFVKREDLDAWIRQHTYEKNQVPGNPA